MQVIGGKRELSRCKVLLTEAWRTAVLFVCSMCDCDVYFGSGESAQSYKSHSSPWAFFLFFSFLLINTNTGFINIFFHSSPWQLSVWLQQTRSLWEWMRGRKKNELGAPCSRVAHTEPLLCFRITGNIKCHFPNKISDETTLLARCAEMCFLLRLWARCLGKEHCYSNLGPGGNLFPLLSVFCCRVFSARSSRLSYRARICCKIHSCGYWLCVFTYFSRRRRKLTSLSPQHHHHW